MTRMFSGSRHTHIDMFIRTVKFHCIRHRSVSYSLFVCKHLARIQPRALFADPSDAHLYQFMPANRLLYIHIEWIYTKKSFFFFGNNIQKKVSLSLCCFVVLFENRIARMKRRKRRTKWVNKQQNRIWKKETKNDFNSHCYRIFHTYACVAARINTSAVPDRVLVSAHTAAGNITISVHWSEISFVW